MSIDDALATLNAGLARDEAIAHAAGGDRWAYDDDQVSTEHQGEVYLPDAVGHFVTRGNEEGTVPGVQLEDGRHIASHDPDRVLNRYIPAIRKVIEAEFENLYEFDNEWGDGCTLEDIRAGRCRDKGAWSASGVFAALAGIYTEPEEKS